MQRRRSTYGPKGEGTFFTHPMSECSLSLLPTLPHPRADIPARACDQTGWVDEYLFGWSQSQAPKTPGLESDAEGATSDFEHQGGSGTRSGYVSGYTTEEPDYDEVSFPFLAAELFLRRDEARRGEARGRRREGEATTTAELELTPPSPPSSPHNNKTKTGNQHPLPRAR
ncbi:hypothetical protein BCR35DRAFT_309442 [Leucosporidium creatinivorum]|uniref:Uncharacterized protein n=1 Tax=Leucosporidium creatinivorum TaxID=106004 RepID=A0A1Y2DIP2_9BASI|nr:hypothetical protein BCR35DRAFT_309442 [Leucosporidium creatinivorum]